jgi:hypothetical protein
MTAELQRHEEKNEYTWFHGDAVARKNVFHSNYGPVQEQWIPRRLQIRGTNTTCLEFGLHPKLRSHLRPH